MPEQEIDARRSRLDGSLIVGFFICLTATLATGTMYVVHNAGAAVSNGLCRHEPQKEIPTTQSASLVANNR